MKVKGRIESHERTALVSSDYTVLCRVGCAEWRFRVVLFDERPPEVRGPRSGGGRRGTVREQRQLSAHSLQSQNRRQPLKDSAHRTLLVCRRRQV